MLAPGPVFGRDEPLLGLNRERRERRIHRDGGDEKRQKQPAESHRLRHAPGPDAEPRSAQRTAAADGQRDDERQRRIDGSRAAENGDAASAPAAQPIAATAAAGRAAAATERRQADDGDCSPDDGRMEQDEPEGEPQP